VRTTMPGRINARTTQAGLQSSPHFEARCRGDDDDQVHSGDDLLHVTNSITCRCDAPTRCRLDQRVSAERTRGSRISASF
jgi:hypothetical protein